MFKSLNLLTISSPLVTSSRNLKAVDGQPQLSAERVEPLASTVSVSCLFGLTDLRAVEKMPEGRRPETETPPRSIVR